MNTSDSATAAGFLELARVGTIWHDAFDGHYVDGDPRNANVPGNADYYLDVSGTSLQLSNTGWVNLSGALRDENVSLPGTVIDDWVQSWWPMEDFPHFSVGGAMAALAATMYDRDVTWCQACELFALHESGTPLTPFNDLWNACTQGRLAGYLGVPPDDRLNMDPTDCEPCEPLSYVDPTDGICKACPAGSVAITGGCDPCPAGQIPRADGSCDACADDQFAQGNVCVDCPDGWLRDGSSNTCLPCPADLVLDWPTARATCGPTVIPVDSTPAADDVCPDDLVVEVTGLSSGGPLIPAVTSPESPSCGERDATFGVVDPAGYELWYYHSPAGSPVNLCANIVCELGNCDPRCVTIWEDDKMVSCDWLCLEEAHCSWVTPPSVSWPDGVRLVVNGPHNVSATLSLAPEEYPEQCGPILR